MKYFVDTSDRVLSRVWHTLAACLQWRAGGYRRTIPAVSTPGLNPGQPVEEPLALSVAAVARRLGVAPATLRTWDRRYGLGPSQHTAGEHRRYTVADVARLDLMRRLIQAGVPSSDAARRARAAQVDAGVAHSPESALAVPPPVITDADDLGIAEVTSAHGGGPVVAIPGGTPAARGLARAAMSLDAAACDAILAETLDRRGVPWTWEHLITPVMIGIGSKWENAGTHIEVEHLLTECVSTAMTMRAHALVLPVNVAPVLLACAPEELHVLPLHALAAALAERRISARVLGARVPAEALAAAIRRTGPAAVVVWSQMDRTGDPTWLADLRAVRPAPLVVAAGPGWSDPLPAEVLRLEDLATAITRIATAVGA